jgi:Protein of unknown function (DUF3311).
MKPALTVLVIVVLLLHQDVWFWRDRTLVFGFLPIGLAYHAGFSVLAAITMSVLVRFLWPADLEDEDEDDATAAAADAPGGRKAEAR